MRVDRNAKRRARRFGNYFADGALGHRLSIDPNPKRFGVVCTTGEYRPIDFHVLVDGFANVFLYGPLVGSLFLGLGGREQDPPRLVDFDDAAAKLQRSEVL